MANTFAKGWKYLMASLDKKIEDNADPKVQIQQAAAAAKQQHADIASHAVSVIGTRSQLEMKLNRLLADKNNLEDQARTSLRAADAATEAGETARAAEQMAAAEVLSTRLVAVENQIEETTALHGRAVEAAEQAEAQVRESEARLREQLDQIEKLRAQVDQTAMRETVNDAADPMDGIGDPDSAVPTLDAVRAKIERRYAEALGSQELLETSVAERMTEIRDTGLDMKAAARLEQIRAEMRKPEITDGSGD
ncbi:PspA/IM30 family protein [Corynebacterium sp. CCM 8835]|uniref:PspA/IM30 family protein n=1 Tax=Corynebacterium antarcticum TaxID=2800405 RepID=A0ABS1FLN6_9CORY|nr:PspA/IM30 family protein [Corynebacterium antarcticum]MCK7642717.1 PspA/IM30 family protein [Corynebacterium antarcticum]MCK7660596.1 PspA/IM30 family protein [Corynebacterium antarcticum]MCL0245341.1 PspA/IM30 family protein [Corynebacterium antarcticum]MCX7492204.1 PspA/IM30 family protein [Corynebacterium antarcticum]MCX7539910.1 PspA/IM30 family protein [Corynebacterium antarcticum]